MRNDEVDSFRNRRSSMTTTPCTMYRPRIQYAQGEYPSSPGSIHSATSAEMARNTRAEASQRSMRRTSPMSRGARRRENKRYVLGENGARLTTPQKGLVDEHGYY